MEAKLKSGNTVYRKSNTSVLGKIVKLFVVGIGTVIVALTSLTACSSSPMVSLNKTVLKELTSSSVVQEFDEREYQGFTFTGADFQKVDEQTLSVDIYGISNWEKDNVSKKGYTTLNYSVEKSNFSKIDKRSTRDVFSALSNMISQKEPNSFSIVEINNIKNFNETAKNFVENTGDSDHEYSKSLIYAVATPQLNETDQTVSFTIKSNVDFLKTWTTTEVYHNSSGYMPVVENHFDHSESVQTHQITLNLTKEEISEISNDEALIFDKFTQFINNNETSKYTISTINIQMDNEYNTNVSKNINLENFD